MLINLDRRLSRVSASSFSNRIGNCRGHSNEGTFPCVFAVRIELFRNIWLVLRATNHATLKIENDYGLVHLVTVSSSHINTKMMQGLKIRKFRPFTLFLLQKLCTSQKEVDSRKSKTIRSKQYYFKKGNSGITTL